LNAQALAIEREREKQRLFLEEQSLKAQGEIKKKEEENLQEQRKLMERTAALLSEQEATKKKEREAIEAEYDRIKKAQLENEQRWSELARNATLAQSKWVPVDERLSLQQGVEEVIQLNVLVPIKSDRWVLFLQAPICQI
jgi:hypothetical protein